MTARAPAGTGVPIRPLAGLLAHVPAPLPPASDVDVTGIAWDSRRVEPGNVFVALRGSHRDGHEFVSDAVIRGATAVVVERDLSEDVGVPVIRVPDTHRALARLAAAWHGLPAQRLRLIGITGTIGKTSVLKALEAILRAAGMHFGGIGSLGVSIGGSEQATGYTAPDPLMLHDALARIAAADCDLAALEVTSHALDQERVYGLEFDVGVFTNLVPLEHADYHRSFRAYVQVKRRFFELVRPGAPLIYFGADHAVRRLVHEADVAPVGCGPNRHASVRIEDVTMDAAGTTFTLHVRHPIPRLDGGRVAPARLPLHTALLGRTNVVNLSLAAATALCVGAPADVIPQTIRALPPVRRRVEIIHRAGFLVLDDTVGHPDAVSAVFEVAGRMPARRIHAVFAIRGNRGVRINRRLGESLAIWVGRHPLETLVITTSIDVADERNRVRRREREAFLEPLRRAGIAHREVPALADAVPAVLGPARAGDLVLLLGAQGMDQGADVARRWLDARSIGNT